MQLKRSKVPMTQASWEVTDLLKRRADSPCRIGQQYYLKTEEDSDNGLGVLAR